MSHNDYSKLPGFDKLTDEQLIKLLDRLMTDPTIVAIKQAMADTAMLMTIQPVIFNVKDGNFDFDPHPVVNTHLKMLRDVELMIVSNFIRENVNAPAELFGYTYAMREL